MSQISDICSKLVKIRTRGIGNVCPYLILYVLGFFLCNSQRQGNYFGRSLLGLQCLHVQEQSWSFQVSNVRRKERHFNKVLKLINSLEWSPLSKKQQVLLIRTHMCKIFVIPVSYFIRWNKYFKMNSIGEARFTASQNGIKHKFSQGNPSTKVTNLGDLHKPSLFYYTQYCYLLF
mgnify:CR=1 FL=1